MIGWDIAITQDGPVIIEGNDNMDIDLPQACNERGLLLDILKYLGDLCPQPPKVCK